jgi:predicted esterase
VVVGRSVISNHGICLLALCCVCHRQIDEEIQMSIPVQNPHAEQVVLHTGAELVGAPAAIIMVHGRGGSAGDFISLAGEFQRPDLAYLVPQAAGSTWYPQRFLAPLAANEPWLSWALERVGMLLAHVQAAGIPAERTVLLGFSQGACLILEYAARNARRYGGVVGLSGGLIGPDGTPRDYAGSLAGTPVFLGCSDIDAHIPKDRVTESAEVLQRLGGHVDARIYPGMDHTISEDELIIVRELLKQLTA